MISLCYEDIGLVVPWWSNKTNWDAQELVGRGWSSWATSGCRVINQLEVWKTAVKCVMWTLKQMLCIRMCLCGSTHKANPSPNPIRCLFISITASGVYSKKFTTMQCKFLLAHVQDWAHYSQEAKLLLNYSGLAEQLLKTQFHRITALT